MGEGGIGRLGMDLRGRPITQRAQDRTPKDELDGTELRPDLAADSGADAGAAARLEAAERLSVATAADETGDMRQLIARVEQTLPRLLVPNTQV